MRDQRRSRAERECGAVLSERRTRIVSRPKAWLQARYKVRGLKVQASKHGSAERNLAEAGASTRKSGSYGCRTPSQCAETFWSAKALAFAFLAGSSKLSKAKTTQAVVEITTRSGERFQHHTHAVRGSATNPMSRDEVEEKSRDLLAPVLGPRRTKQLIETVRAIELVKDLCQLRRLLQPS